MMQHDRAMVAFFVPQNVALVLGAFKGYFPPGSEITDLADYHVTLAYLTDVQSSQRELLRDAVRVFAQKEHPISGQIGGVGRFSKDEDGRNPFYTSLDAPTLPGFRQRLVERLEQYGFLVSKMHGFIPHCTMAYIPINLPTPPLVIPQIGVTFGCVWLAFDDDRERFSLNATAIQLKKRLGRGAESLKQVVNYGKS